MHFHVQDRLFLSALSSPCLGELTVACVDGSWSLGGRVMDLVTLAPIAITAGPALEPATHRSEAHEWLDELLDVLEQQSGAPFELLP
jgi:hypothetical protein